MTFKIIRRFENPKYPDHVIERNLTEDEAKSRILNYKTCKTTACLRRLHNFGPWWDEMEEE